MPAQYDNIGSSYSNVYDLPTVRCYSSNIRLLVEPLVKNNARVLDLACGAGFFSREVLKWGAREVVGVDISTAMIDVAKDAAVKERLNDRSTFLVADGSEPTVYEGGQFHVVIAIWFLNYAEDMSQLIRMFETVSLNLKPGGILFALQRPQVEEPMDVIRSIDSTFVDKYSHSLVCQKSVEDGYLIHATVHVQPKNIEFDTYYLRKSVFEQSARAAGFSQPLQMAELKVSDELLKEFEPGFWDDYLQKPSIGMFMVKK